MHSRAVKDSQLNPTILRCTDCNQIMAGPEKFRIDMGTQYDSCTVNIWKYCSHGVFQSYGFSPAKTGNVNGKVLNSG